MLAFLSPLIVFVAVSVLHAFVPTRKTVGYVKREGSNETLQYRLNGLLVLVLVAAGWLALCRVGYLDYNWFYLTRWEGFTGAAVFGLLFSAVLVLPAKPVSNSLLLDYYTGRWMNPQLFNGHVDLKMLLYLVGAVQLFLNIASAAIHHHQLYNLHEQFSGIILSTALMSFFLVEYLFFENVHLYTYDFVAERLGFKLGWGCIAFYPYFYAIPMFSAAHLEPVFRSTSESALVVALFVCGWSFARGANMQKYYFKLNPNQSFLRIKPQFVTAPNGSKVLVNGFWGLSRHVNYLGEILMASAIALAVGHPTLPWPWLYPFYYFALLFPRQAEDDKRCAAKYKAAWTEYVKRVPYRIVPFVY